MSLFAFVFYFSSFSRQQVFGRGICIEGVGQPLVKVGGRPAIARRIGVGPAAKASEPLWCAIYEP